MASYSILIQRQGFSNIIYFFLTGSGRNLLNTNILFFVMISSFSWFPGYGFKLVSISVIQNFEVKRF